MPVAVHKHMGDIVHFAPANDDWSIHGSTAYAHNTVTGLHCIRGQEDRMCQSDWT